MCGTRTLRSAGSSWKRTTSPSIHPRPGMSPSSLPRNSSCIPRHTPGTGTRSTVAFAGEDVGDAQFVERAHGGVECADTGQDPAIRLGDLVLAVGDARLWADSLEHVRNGAEVPDPGVDHDEVHPKAQDTGPPPVYSARMGIRRRSPAVLVGRPRRPAGRRDRWRLGLEPGPTRHAGRGSPADAPVPSGRARRCYPPPRLRGRVPHRSRRAGAQLHRGAVVRPTPGLASSRCATRSAAC